jgi:hypothetical protein
MKDSLWSQEFSKEYTFEQWISGTKGLYNKDFLMGIDRNELEKQYGSKYVNDLLNTFSINRNIDRVEEHENLEIFCFYETKIFIICGIIDFSQTLSIFEKFLMSGNYIDLYKKGISSNTEFKRSQKRLSQYFSYCVADQLWNKGYRLPMKKYKGEQIPRADIDKIKISKKNILMDYGDIDVLALDTEKKEVILFELKYYKPYISLDESLSKDQRKFEEDEVTRKVKKREEIVSENIEGVVEYILGEPQSGYTVKSILLTPRANSYANNQKDICYLTWAEFLEKVKDKQL